MRVRQNADFLIEQVRSAAAGRLVPAAFQRPYVWTRDDVEALWTSLSRGWPIGSLLIWQPPRDLPMADAGRLRLGPVEASGGEWTSMLLDGQNRMATVAWSLLDPGSRRPDDADLSPVERDTWDPSHALVCDYETRSVRFVPATEAGEGYRFPAACLVDSIAMNRAFRAVWARGMQEDEPLQWMDNLANTVRDARVAVTVLENATPQEAVEAFRHVARVGQPVTAEDVEAALEWVLRTGTPAPR